MKDHEAGTGPELDLREALLSDRVSGELGAEGEATWRRSVALDPTLAAEADSLSEVRARLRELPQSLAPERDLWAGIAARIDQMAQQAQPAADSRRRWQLAAVLVAAVASAFVLGRWSRTVPTAAPSAPIEAVRDAPPAAIPDSTPVLANYAPAGESLTVTADALRQAFAARRSELPASTVMLVERNLETIDQAIAEIELALATRPGDRELGRTLIGYQLRQIAVLSQVQRATARL